MSNSSLGRGLGSLIPVKSIKENISEEIIGGKEKTFEISLDKIQPNPHQPRHHFDRDMLEDLVNSIKEHGIIQPLIVNEVGSGYELIAGERRLRASKIAGLSKVPVVVRTATEQQKLELAIVENVQRQNLNPIEKAYGYQRLAAEFNLTQEEVSKKIGQSRTAVTNSLRLLTLSAEIQKSLQEGKITEGHAKVLLGIKDVDQRRRLFKEILSGSLSVRKTESKAGKVIIKKHTRNRNSKDVNMTEKEELLQEALGTKVELSYKKGQGVISIHFYSNAELQEIIRKIVN
ncbi:MAG: ParB/RepB/Spo0J family partition protein [Candidatus Kerfeldbacteria bacterium]|jgi:ParB family transcriptional regulator, chromosome partitioning protein